MSEPDTKVAIPTIPPPLSFPTWPYHGEDEIQAVAEVLRSANTNDRTAGRGREFEKAFATYTGCAFATSVANGTLALELALQVLDIGPGHDVVVPSRTFIATASAVARVGARPIVADVDPISQNILAESINAVLTPKTKAVIVVHLAGWPCDMDPVLELAQECNLWVIEDCAQAHGARYKGRPVGSIGHLGAFSFCHDKILSLGGEGGMLTSNQETLWRRAFSLKDHGKNHALLDKPSHNYPWPHETFGSNYRLTEMQAVIGSIQLKQLEEWQSIRQRNADILTSYLKTVPCLIPQPPDVLRHAWYRYYFFPELDKLKRSWSRDRILAELKRIGIPCSRGSCSEIQRERAFEKYPEIHNWQTPIAEDLGKRSLALPLHPTLEEHHMRQIGQEIRRILIQAFQ